jgi:DNA-binding LacI/PurR family transcriptional regulator
MQQDSATLGSGLRAFMREHRYTQAYVAEQAKVDQATVSRFLKKPPQRVTSATRRLCSYAQSVLSKADMTGDQAAAQNALQVCWNKSDAHAQATSKILNALAELCRQG